LSGDGKNENLKDVLNKEEKKAKKSKKEKIKTYAIENSMNIIRDDKILK